MTYVMSDLHGCYRQYAAMLKRIQFTEDDMLYIVGDVVDRGEYGIKLLLDVMNRPNVRLLMGNHEYLMAALLSNIKEPLGHATALDNNMSEALKLWVEDGGQPTLRDYIDLSWVEQKRIVSYLVKLPLYAEVTVNGQAYLLVHAGLDHFSPERLLKDYRVEELLFHRSDPDQVYFADKIVVVGHTPTFDYGKNLSGRMLRIGNVINIDCGCVYPESNSLGCLRLEDQMEFYQR